MILTHLWQSTLCLGIAALLALALRRSSARTRHNIWLLASLKFLLPFSVLVSVGTYLGSWSASLTTSGGPVGFGWLDGSLALWRLDVSAAAGVGEQFGISGIALLALTGAWLSGIAGFALWRWRQWHAIAKLARDATRLESGREADALARVTRTLPRPRQVDLRLSHSSIEPGVLGLFRPTLLWPVGLSERLSDAELDAILAHELCHVARRDNWWAAMQTIVETVFWFHPGVWWLGARLIIERERACDEEVVHMGTDRKSYAEGILKVCGFCLRAPAVFVAGVGGSRLTERIEAILGRPPGVAVTLSARLLLLAVLAATLGTPLAAGVLKAHRGIAAESHPPLTRQDEAQVYRPGEGVTHPRLVSEVKPKYTDGAKKARIQGSVGLEAVVLTSGAVDEVTVVRSLDTVHGLDDEAVKALKQWRFEPGTKDKKPVAVRVEVEMSFTLK